MEKIKENPLVKKIGFNRIILVGVLLLMYVLFGLMTGGSFFGMTRILNTLNYAYFLGFLSLGVTFVIATGGIDFSIGPMMFLNRNLGISVIYVRGCLTSKYFYK